MDIVDLKGKMDIAVSLAAVAADPTNAKEQLSATSAVIDKAAAKGVIHKNAANRKKARLAKQLNKAAAV